jgi:steroid 5-alpha reductase family enzyme
MIASYPLFFVLLLGQALVCLWMAGLYVWGRKAGNMGTVDVGWSAGIAISAVLYLLLLPSATLWRTLLGGGLLIVWALRLSAFIYSNRVAAREEDARYARLRTHWGKAADAKFFWFVYQSQAFLVTLFMIPFLVLLTNPVKEFRMWDLLAVLIWVVSLLGESVADRQLAHWRAQPENRGKTCRSGFWRYSRHPNYFFEWVHWFTYVCFSFGAPGWPWSLAGPVLMFIFLFWVTGIPHTEKQALVSRGDDYRDYQSTTPMFFPWFPKKVK